ncbi:MAG TPA: SH3 domain-containing protein [Aggregatilineales bacterium]|nr:SH3 domain-containing protein [Aggregatilineales bacterium]
MNTRRLVVLIMLFLSIGLVIPVRAAGSAVTITVVTNNNLNLRAGPSMGAAVLAVVPIGTKLSAYARDVTALWVVVSFAGQNGWLYVPFLTRSGSVTSLPIANQNAVLPPVAGGGTVTATALVDMNIRGGPGKQFELLGFLFAGDTVILDGRSFGWLRYNFSGFTKGWLRGDLVAVEGDLSSLPDVTFPPQ